jgi:hypothetical protein
VITELNISSNRLGFKTAYDHDGTDMSGVIDLADVIPGMGGLSKLIFNGGVDGFGGWTEGDIATLESSMTGANFSNKKLGVPGAMIISAWLSSGKDKGALSSLNLAANNLGELVLPEGWSKEDDWGDITYKHADGREQKEDPGSKPEGIIALANAIPNMGAMTSLNLSNNDLGPEGAKHLAEGIKVMNCVVAVILV